MTRLESDVHALQSDWRATLRRMYPLTLEEDARLLAAHPGLYEDDPKCPHCGHLHASWWNAHSELRHSTGEDGDNETVHCPKCQLDYLCVLHVKRITSITAA